MKNITRAAIDTDSRDRLVTNHVSLVRAVACRLAHRLPAQVELSELIGVGTLALVDAAGRYKPSLGVPFDAFARQRVQGAMLDSLRGMDWAPRSLRQKQRALDGAIKQLRHELGREPEAAQIAAALNVSEAEYDRMLDDVRSAELATIRLAGTDANGESLLDVATDPGEGQHARLERLELARRLAVALAALPDRERQVLSLYYEEELTLAEVGEVLGVSESRISQLRTQAIARLRTSLQETAGRQLH